MVSARQPQHVQDERLGHRILVGGLAGFALLLFLALYIRVPVTLLDDAFITFRYAANLAQGNGLVYNVGERVLGTTTPLYALLLGGVAAVLGVDSLPTVSHAINGAALLAAAFGFALGIRRATGNRLLAATAFAATLLGPINLMAGLGGMESSLFLALVIWALLAYDRRQFRLAAGLVGWSAVLRPEGLIVLGVMAGGVALQTARTRLPRLPWPALVAALPPAPRWGQVAWMASLALAPLLTWSAVAQAVYGQVVPQSVVAKQSGLYPIGMGSTLGSIVSGVTASFYGAPLAGDFEIAQVVAGGLAVGFIAVGGIALSRASAYWTVLPLLGVLFALFYVVTHALIFAHYWLHFETLLKVAWMFGLFTFLTPLCARFQWSRQVPALLTAILVLAPPLTLYPWTSVAQGAPIGADSFFSSNYQRLVEYRELATALAPHIPDGAVVAMPEIGVLGFDLMHVTVLDTAGLVSPIAVAYHPVPASQRVNALRGVVPPGLIQDQRPDLLITLEIFIRHGVLDDAWFWQNYTPVHCATDADLPWDSQALFVFARNDYAPGLALAQVLDTADCAAFIPAS